MISAREISSSLYGAFRLAAGHTDGMEFFNRTTEGFWHSFFAAALVAPGYFILGLIDSESVPAVPLHDAIVRILAYVIVWVAYPSAMIPVTRLLEREDRYIGYIVAYNWGQVPQMLLFLTVTIVADGLGFGSVLNGLAGITTLGLVLTYYWFIARTALDVPGTTAAGIVALNLTLTFIISEIAHYLTNTPLT
jgi:hypothetical protein